MFAEPVRRWPWTPQFKHLLVDQSQTGVGAVQGETLGRVAQLALMAAARHEVRAALEMAVQLMRELDRAGQGERFRAVVFYVLHTQDKETLREFFAALRREVPGPGGDMMTYAEELIREGRQEGVLKAGRRVVRRAIRRVVRRVVRKAVRKAKWPRSRVSARRRRVADHQAGYRHRPGGVRVAPPTDPRLGSGALTQFSHPTGSFGAGLAARVQRDNHMNNSNSTDRVLIEAFTDGVLQWQSRDRAAWAYHLTVRAPAADGGAARPPSKESGAAPRTTNNRMELAAVIQALLRSAACRSTLPPR